MSLESPFKPPSKPGNPRFAKVAHRLLSSEDAAAVEAIENETQAKPKQKAPNWSPEGDLLTKEEREAREKQEQEAKGHITLRNIPRWTTLPNEEAIKKDFKFDWIWSREYKKDRKVEDFKLLLSDLEAIGLSKPLQASLLKSIESAKGKESLPGAKVFEIGDVIRKKKEEDSNHRDYLSTNEVLEAIDEAGYRPATLEELLAYSRDHWKPEVDPETLTEEEKAKNAHTSCIYAAGSVFSRSEGSRDISCLHWRRNMRELDAGATSTYWTGDNRFLVFSKESL